MTSIVDDSDVCPLCKAGHFHRRDEEVAFLQWTDKGPLRCRVTVAVAVCNHCGFRTWDQAAEAVMNEAVHRAYNELP